MAENLLEELKDYVRFGPADEVALRALHPLVKPRFEEIANVFYQRILDREGPREVLVGGESSVGRLKVTLVAWMDKLLSGPWDAVYLDARCRIGRVHVRIGMPQHYMFGAMSIVRQQFERILHDLYADNPAALVAADVALGKVLDIELAIMLHTYREDLLAQQARTERLSVFGQLVGSIGHELRNPLGVIETSLYILRQRTGNDERIQKHADRIGEQLSIANQIISDLLDLIRDKPLSRTAVSIGATIAAATDLIRLPPGVRVVTDGLEELPPVSGDSNQLRQVFVNLVENGSHAAAPNGEVRVSGRVDNVMVEVSVQDTGSGIDPAIRQRLFEPLITTKTKGIGLGLALVKRIVEHHGGTVACVSKPGEGARFIVRLPIA